MSIVYSSLEPSSRPSISLFITASILRGLKSTGKQTVLYLQDKHAFLTNKLDADEKKIATMAKYTIEIWNAMKVDGVDVKLASEEIGKRPNEFWIMVMDIARRFELKKVLACGQNGVEEKEELDVDSSRILCPCMQIAEPFFLNADAVCVTSAKSLVTEMSREYCTMPEIAGKNLKKPDIILEETLMNLKNPLESNTSDPDALIFMDDEASDVKKKINRAFCTPNEVDGNPVLDYVKKLVLPILGKLDITRGAEHGGNVSFTQMSEIEEAYRSGSLHPGDLKTSVIVSINSLLEPIRNHLSKAEVKKLSSDVKKMKVSAK